MSILERAHDAETFTIKFLVPKNPILDTKIIEICPQEGARGFVQ